MLLCLVFFVLFFKAQRDVLPRKTAAFNQEVKIGENLLRGSKKKIIKKE